ncbi:MBL fold metallo-hydrolase [Leptolyngbya sp. NIES-2104]|uniref:MBL fold metallo-hydrolase n=1 Tax=Leptolyngbya sp. NIES-2104 TaxID=1552121 RepID=UPI00073E5464|nr:MBL fold metallo-hydrolase [Leptolyngbya sp. NIES-2104]
MPPESFVPSQSRTSKPPRLVFSEETCPGAAPVFAFPPNRDTLGGTSYLIVEKDGNLMIDSPAWDENTRSFLDSQGGVSKLVITHRGGMGKVREIQEAFGCDVIVQEQEAYLLPNVSVTGFQDSLEITPNFRVIWTSGHSPGSACVYYSACGGILFSGRHLIPNSQGDPVPLRTAKTFHWTRQIRHVRKLLEMFSPETLQFICPGASSGLLRGKFAIDQAYSKLAQLDLEACLKSEPLL